MKITKATFLFLFLFVCAANAQSKKLPVQLVNRTWNRTVTIRDGNSIDYSITFKQDSTFQLNNLTTNFSVTLTLKFEEGKVIFPAGSGGCSEEGEYKFMIKGNNLTFESNVEDCNVRKETLMGVWKTKDKVKK